jgi:hypothetical protein
MNDRSDPRPRWRVVTSSYLDYHPDLGVPIGTSIGRHPDYATAPEIHSLKPWGVFRVLDDAPLDERITAYRHQLHRRRREVERALDDLTATYPDLPLVLLCWCTRADADANECHRRWAAAWLSDVYGVDVPEARS